jgi:hypothetical protein
MKTLLSIAAALAAITSASVAFAHDAPATGTFGHYEWQSRPTFGPRALLSAPVRIWVSDAKGMASCDCAMMHETAMAADCMAMPRKGSSAPHG